jgi:hypothetical protein
MMILKSVKYIRSIKISIKCYILVLHVRRYKNICLNLKKNQKLDVIGDMIIFTI